MCHDITHCKGIGCPIRDNCYRYQAHLDVVSDKYQSTRILYFDDDYLCNKAKEILNSEPIKGKEPPHIDDRYYCASCGSHSHRCDPRTGCCYECGADDWEPEPGKYDEIF